MGRSLRYEIPGDDPRVSAEEVEALGWRALFARARPRAHGHAGEGAAAPVDPAARRCVLEIGFGRGEFLLALAEAAPETDFIGVEVSWKRTLKMARKVARARRTNVLLTVGRGEAVLRDAFAPASLAEIWVNFPDPWPKRRHADRRLVKPAFVALAARALAPGGTLFVATDDVPYAHQIDEALAGEKGLESRDAPLAFLPEVPGRMTTGYEAQWRAEGRPLHFFAYAARAGGRADAGGAADAGPAADAGAAR
ncbi:MAG: tRNA (guanine(46)-N(7))-methyltransferase TrmB [Myxococcota bacterium]